jgi:predicted DCC family thiol-disulfide oxidoreductase YuxK
VTPPAHHVVFFDGVCGLCNRAVHFLIARDRRDRLRFAPLQGELARRVLVPLGGRPDELDTFYLVTTEGRLLERSRAVLFAVTALGGAWSLLAVLWVIPRPIADLLYRLVARVRYRLFGRSETCPVPAPAVRARFLEATLNDPAT